jgi:CBS domain-containing protein
MSEEVLTIGPGHSLREAAAAMWARQVGAAVVHDPEAPAPGVITERDVLEAVAQGKDPDAESVAEHLTANLTFASQDWSLEHAAAIMVSGRFRHLVVVEGSDVVGVLSMRDIVRAWCGEGADCAVPARAG